MCFCRNVQLLTFTSLIVKAFARGKLLSHPTDKHPATGWDGADRQEGGGGVDRFNLGPRRRSDDGSDEVLVFSSIKRRHEDDHMFISLT